MLKPLLTNCILHLLKHIETHATQCFAIILEWFSEFCHFFLNYQYLYTWVESSTLKLLKVLSKCCTLHLLVYIETQITT
jgi:hypothetical protein